MRVVKYLAVHQQERVWVLYRVDLAGYLKAIFTLSFVDIGLLVILSGLFIDLLKTITNYHLICYFVLTQALFILLVSKCKIDEGMTFWQICSYEYIAQFQNEEDLIERKINLEKVDNFKVSVFSLK